MKKNVDRSNKVVIFCFGLVLIGQTFIGYKQGKRIDVLEKRECILTNYCKSSAKIIEGLYFSVKGETMRETVSRHKGNR